MTDTPERIWVAPWREGDWDDNEGKTLNDKPCIQYVRADRIEQLVATNEALIAENAKLHDHIEGVAKGIHKIMVGYEAKLAKAEAGLLAIAKRDEQMIWGEDYEVEEAFKDMRDIALATLAAVTETHKIKSSEAAPPYGLEGESHE
jgi:hypothetical protein